MLTPAKTMERYSNGQAGVPADQRVSSTVALPPRWTEDDTKGFGFPVVIGHPDTEFVAVIESVAPTGIPRWIGELSRQRFAEAPAGRCGASHGDETGKGLRRTRDLAGDGGKGGRGGRKGSLHSPSPLNPCVASQSPRPNCGIAEPAAACSTAKPHAPYASTALEHPIGRSQDMVQQPGQQRMPPGACRSRLTGTFAGIGSVEVAHAPV